MRIKIWTRLWDVHISSVFINTFMWCDQITDEASKCVLFSSYLSYTLHLQHLRLQNICWHFVREWFDSEKVFENACFLSKSVFQHNNNTVLEWESRPRNVHQDLLWCEERTGRLWRDTPDRCRYQDPGQGSPQLFRGRLAACFWLFQSTI